jgi:transposase-like protein
MAKPLERQIARELRQAGMPYKRIAARLGVSPSSVYAWTSDIQLTEEQSAANLRGPKAPLSPEGLRRRSRAWAARCRQRRAASQQEGRDAARRGDRLHLAGCMLYWAEGGKGRNAIQFTNSDPRMAAFFRRFLVEALGIAREDIRLSINVYTNNGMSIEQIETYWLDLLHLPKTSARAHMLNHMPTSSSGRARNKLPYGVARLTVNQTDKVQHIYGAIQEYAGFEEPAWLDCAY